MEHRADATVDEVLTAEQVRDVLQQAVGGGWRLARAAAQPAAAGLSGFLGDHFRVTFDVTVGDAARKVHVFVKSMPRANGPKAKFIDEHDYYRREKMMFELFGKMRARVDESSPWCASAYICTDTIVVMPDLVQRGYRQLPVLDCMDLEHALLTAAAIARFHAAFANYETRRSLAGREPFSEKHARLLEEPTFKDSPWLRAAAKLTANFLAAFSDERSRYPPNLEDVLRERYVEACDSLAESDSLNVVLHKDLWVNNIMFQYEGRRPASALLIDFQCVRYGPPAFDLMIFLYLNTSRSFRERHEAAVLEHYHGVFSERADDATRARLRALGYDRERFAGWCRRARMFGMVEAIGIFPYVLMEPAAARRAFDDPATFERHCDRDRSRPVLAHARACAPYRARQLELCEEFVQRYVLSDE